MTKFVEVTLLDNTTIQLSSDDIKEVTQNMGDVHLHHKRCDVYYTGGFPDEEGNEYPRQEVHVYCEVCKKRGDGEHCGLRWVVVSSIREEPEPVKIQLKNGSVLYAKDFNDD